MLLPCIAFPYSFQSISELKLLFMDIVLLHGLKQNHCFFFLTQEKNIFLNTNADSVIQGNHTRSNNSILEVLLLNTIPLTWHSSHDVVRHGMPVALWSSTLLSALILLDKATSILHTRHVHLPFVRACHLYSNHPIYKS